MRQNRFKQTNLIELCVTFNKNGCHQNMFLKHKKNFMEIQKEYFRENGALDTNT